MRAITWDGQRCYGCRSCQLACSVHHSGSFWPERSSIQVRRKPRAGTVEWRIDDSCDGCPQEAVPMCIAHCTYEALHLVELTDDAA